jgi:hypothetical protein
VESLEFVAAVETAADAGLVGHHEHPPAEVVEALHRLSRAGHPAQLLRPPGVADVFVQHAITVEEDRRPGGARQGF